MAESAINSEQLLIETLAISGRYAVLDEVTTKMLPHSFSTLVEAERYVELLLQYHDAGIDPESAAAAVAGEPLSDALTASAHRTGEGDGIDPSIDDDDEDQVGQRGWATIAPDNARIGGPVAEWMTTYPHRRALSATELAEHMDRLSKHGHSFALVAFSKGRITEIARLERGEGLQLAQPQPER